ncbi:MAG: hypothetical protein CMJ20_00740 [Phycisphaeraceae bacterium]|nr:hypothetical protein [Phycisphaeraceae bacterium]
MHPPRKLRRCALLNFPSKSFNVETLDAVIAEGFTDIGISVFHMDSGFEGTGFTLDQGHQIAQWAHERNLGSNIFTLYMKCKEKLIQKTPHRAMYTQSMRSNPEERLKARAACPFQPEAKEEYMVFLRQVVQWPGIREVHFNDEGSLNVSSQTGCYCDYCCSEFKTLTGNCPPESDYEPDNPIWWQWTDFRMQRWTGVHAEFRGELKKLAPDVLFGIQHSTRSGSFAGNPWNEGLSLARDAQALDVLATNPYQYRNFNIVPHRPHRRVLAEGTRALAGACLNKQVNIYPQGFMPSTKTTPMSRQDGILAGIIPFALGADTITPYTYELMNIIPGFAEGFEDTRRLLPEFEAGKPYTFSTAIRPLQSEVRGHHEENWGHWYLTELADVMLHTGMSWSWFWDERLEDAADHLHGPVIFPDTHCLTEKQMAAVQQVAQGGEGVLWIGNMPHEPWNGQGECPLPAPFKRGEFELIPETDHPVFEGVDGPIMLQSCARSNVPEGTILGSIDSSAGLVVSESEHGGRQAWLAGVPFHVLHKKGHHGAIRQPVSGCALIRNLLQWLSPSPPAVRLEPFPPPNDYGKLRPWDVRDIPTMELLPIVRDGALCAIIFPYAPVGFETSLVVNLPKGTRLTGIRELWDEQDLTESAQQNPQGELRIPLDVPGSCEVLAILVEYQ